MTQTQKKTQALFKLMEHFLIQKEISSYDERILDEFGCDKKTLERYLKEIEELYTHIVTIKRGHKKVWKLVSVSDVFEEFLKNSDDLSDLFLMAQEFDPSVFKELERGTLAKIAKDDEVFLFKNYIMEDLQSMESKAIFKNLKQAIARHEYRDIVYVYNNEVMHKNLKCIKLLFINNNWYLVGVDDEKHLHFRRLSFIKEVRYSKKNSFQKHEVKVYLEFLSSVQTAMTLYGVTPKKATIKALPCVAKYFKKGMKKILPSQKFIKVCDDGSVLFSLAYTQELEVLPLIQKWLPDLVVVAPQELKEAYAKKLEEAFKNHLN